MMKRLNDWMFGFGSPATLAVYRILIGTLALANWALLTPFYADWFTESGFISRELSRRWAGELLRIDPFTILPSDTLAQVAWWVMGATALMTLLGWKTRYATIVLFICTTAFHHRNPVILHSGDTLLRMSLFALALAPCGLMYSLDARGKKGDIPQVSLWPQRLIQIQMAVMYGTTVIHKAYGELWLNGTAAWYPTRLAEFTRFPVPAFLDTTPFLQIATYGTLLIEIALATLVFAKPFRKWVLIGGLLLHGFIEWRMNIPLFAFISCAQYVAHYDGTEVRLWVERFQSKFKKVKHATA